MKKVIYSLFAGIMMLSSCADFTEIQPKGKNMLSSCQDLELLLNQNMSINWGFALSVGADLISTTSNILPDFSKENKSASTLYFGFFDDETSLKRIEEMNNSDSYYTNCYAWAGKIANPILQQLPNATGTQEKKNQLKSEALALRAYAHFLILQKYAKAYNPATAAKDPGVIYLTEDVDILVNQSKKSVAECYEMAYNDINEAIKLGGLPETRANASRLSKGAGHAIKAYICMAMQKYSEAKTEANLAIAQTNSMYNYEKGIEQRTNRFGGDYIISMVNAKDNPEVLFVAPEKCTNRWVTPEMWNSIEDGYYTKTLYPTNEKLEYMTDTPDKASDISYGLPGWKACYNNEENYYDNASGLQTSMMYLFIAECELRDGDVNAAMRNLDILRKAHMTSDKYTALENKVTTKAEGIEMIKMVSFEENVWNGWNYVQRRRWNVEPEWQTTLTRTIDGTTYTLSPSSDLWVFPFPTNVRDLNPNLVSNKNK